MKGSLSLRATLLGWLALGLLGAVIVAALATYFRAREEANVLFDYQLQQMASSLTGMPLAGGAPPGAPPGADALVVQVWDRNGMQVYLSQPQSHLPRHAQLGFNTIATEAGQWRVFSMLAGQQVVQVAQPMSVRTALAASMALRTIVPLLAVMPFLAIVVWFAIARALRPLDRLAFAVGTRSLRVLEPLPEAGLPREVMPLVHALNALLDRLDRALDAQRTFIADAAHELRTPLTAVHLQAQLAQRASTEDDRHAAFGELTAGLDRATHLVEQLLTLAREEPGLAERPIAPVELGELARSVVGEHAALAASRHIDLGFARGSNVDQRVVITGDATGLHTLLSNLVDNALRYTPAGGRVDVSVGYGDGGRDTTLSVCDSGPGIAPAEYPRVFDRFYRSPDASAPGSGLGLAIVRRIADRHGATIELGRGIGRSAGGAAFDARDGAEVKGSGLGITVRFPAQS